MSCGEYALVAMHDTRSDSMELQFGGSTCRFLKAAVREVHSTELTQEVRLSDGMPDIGRVLTSWGQIILRSKEWQSDLVTVSGGIMVWVLYVPEDGTPVRCVDTWVPFQLKWETNEPHSEGAVRAYPLLRYVDGRGVSPRKMMIRASVGAMGEAWSLRQLQVYHPTEVPQDVQLLKHTYPIRLPVEISEKTFLLDDDLQMPAGAVQPERLLAYTIAPQLQEKRISGDKLVVRGAGKLHVLYRCSEGKIHAADLEIPISQYAQLEKIYDSDANADVMMGITSLELIQNDGQQLRIKCTMAAQYLISDRYLIDVVEDAYSPNREVELRMEEVKLPSVAEQRSELVQAHQKIQGISADYIVDAWCLPDFPRQNRNGDQVTLDCAGQFQMLYYAADDTLQSGTCGWESAVQIMADSNSNMSFLVQQPNAVQAVPAADEMHFNTQIKLELNTELETNLQTVTGLELGQLQEPDDDRPSLILCRSYGESLWELAKRCGSTVDDIRRINHLDAEPRCEQMLLIPVV